MKNVIVVGGGAAGMIAALTAANKGHKVLLIEKNEKLGKKIYITGKGRCNVTNACDTADFFSHVITNPKFLYSAIYSFDSSSLMALIEENGTPLKIERGNRVFPKSDHASDITKAFLKAISAAGVEIMYNTRVKEILIEKDRVKGLVLDSDKSLTSDGIILATGGLSYPSTGSSGDGHKMLSKLGFKITPTRPALTDLIAKEEYIHSLQGLSLKNIDFCVGEGKRPIFKGFGELLFTHRGVSGPLVLTASSLIKPDKLPLKAYIDLKPKVSRDELDIRLRRIILENGKKQYMSLYKGLVPGALMEVMAKLSKIDKNRKLSDITQKEREVIINLLKEFPLTITATGGYNEAVITQGGLDVKQVDPSTMELKSLKGLYVAGELLDIDATTGGFNLQCAFSTGYLAGISI